MANNNIQLKGILEHWWQDYEQSSREPDSCQQSVKRTWTQYKKVLKVRPTWASYIARTLTSFDWVRVALDRTSCKGDTFPIRNLKFNTSLQIESDVRLHTYCVQQPWHAKSLFWALELGSQILPLYLKQDTELSFHIQYIYRTKSTSKFALSWKKIIT
jgi:hypothetical protein